MKTISLTEYFGAKKTEIDLYDSIHQLPARLYHNYNKYMLYNQQVGSTVIDIDNHFHKMGLWLWQDNYDRLRQERRNLQMNFYAILTGLNLKNIAFCSLIHSVEGIEIKDYSEEHLNKLATRLSKAGLTVGKVNELTLQIGNLIHRELKNAFPDRFSSATMMNYNGQNKKKGLLILQGIEHGEFSNEIELIDKWQSKFMAPKSMHPSDRNNEINRIDTDFEDSCIFLEKHGVKDPKNITVYEYYKRIDFYKPKQQQ